MNSVRMIVQQNKKKRTHYIVFVYYLYAMLIMSQERKRNALHIYLIYIYMKNILFCSVLFFLFNLKYFSIMTMIHIMNWNAISVVYLL